MFAHCIGWLPTSRGHSWSFSTAPRIDLCSVANEREDVLEGLQNAWKDEANLAVMLGSIDSVFGDSLQPYVPWAAIEQLS